MYTHISWVRRIYTCRDVVTICSVRVPEHEQVLGGIPRDRGRDGDGEQASSQGKTTKKHAGNLKPSEYTTSNRIVPAPLLYRRNM